MCKKKKGHNPFLFSFLSFSEVVVSNALSLCIFSMYNLFKLYFFLKYSFFRQSHFQEIKKLIVPSNHFVHCNLDEWFHRSMNEYYQVLVINSWDTLKNVTKKSLYTINIILIICCHFGFDQTQIGAYRVAH